MVNNYYYADAEKNPQGPYDLFQLEGMLDGCQITSDTLVIREGEHEWAPLGKVLIETQAAESRDVASIRTVAFGQIIPNKYFFIAPVLRMISEGRLFNRVFDVATRVGAVIIAIVMLVAWFKLWETISDLSKYRESGGIILGGALLQIVFLIGIYMVTHVQWIRAKEIGAQPPSEFTIIPIFSISLRMTGEIFACLSIVLGVGGFLLILCAGSNGGFILRELSSAMPGLGISSSSGDGTFLSALAFLLVNAATAFLTLVLFYLLAEVIVVIVDMAKNIRNIRERLENLEEKKPDPVFQKKQ